MNFNRRAFHVLTKITWFIFLVIVSCTSENHGVDDASALENLHPKLNTRPNIIWLVAEDLSPIIPPFGDSTIITPNLNRLAREGVRFTNVYSPSGVCAPSRLAITTGMYPSSIGGHNMRVQWNKAIMDSLGLPLYEVVTPPEVRMMSELLRNAGYYCTNNDKTDYQFVAPATAWNESSTYAHWRNRKDHQPFFSVFNFDITHESHVFWPTSKKNLRYDDNFPQDPLVNPVAKWNEKIDSTDWELLVEQDLEVPIPPYLPSTEPVKKDIRRVYSNILAMDEQVGKLLHQLEVDGLLENTIIVWYTDHGGPLPRQKRLLYDSGIKVPMIIRFPQKQFAGQIDEQLISFIDLAPTMLTMAGVEHPGYFQGRAFIGKTNLIQRKYIHAAADRFDGQYDRIRAVRDKRFKYLKNYNTDQPYYLPITYRENMQSMQELLRLHKEGKLDAQQAQWFRPNKPDEELFDCINDPHELINLAENPKYTNKLTELRQECEKWMTDIGDMGDTPEIEIINNFWPDLIQPTTQNPSIQNNTQEITLTSTTPGASIAYQVLTSSQNPSDEWEVYAGPFKIKAEENVICKAHRIGYKPSITVSLK